MGQAPQGKVDKMKAKYICHPDFRDQSPLDHFGKEVKGAKNYAEEDERFLARHILFRKKITLESFERATLKVTADDYYKLYINGSYVGCGPAASYPWGYNVNEIDVTDIIREGENLFALHTYYQGLINRVWVSADRRACMLFELKIDGKTVLVSDESWLCADHSGYSTCGKFGYDTQFAECYDSRSTEVGFERCDFDDSGWGNACIYKNADYTTRLQSTVGVELYRVDAVKREQRGNTVILDFGQEAVGYLGAFAKGRCGDEIVLRYAEELNDDGTPRHIMRCNCVYEEKWILSGEVDELCQFDYKGFRYASLTLPESAELLDVYMDVRHYPYERRATFSTEDERLIKIIELCENTVKYGMQENFVDCPTREKGQYLGDVTIAARAHAILTKDTSMLRKALSDFADSALICKGLMAVSGAGLMQEIADYSLQYASSALFCYKLDGDKEFLASLLPTVMGVYEYFSSYDRGDGLIIGCDKWNLVDWPSNLRDGYEMPEDAVAHNVLNAFWCGFLKDVEQIHEILGIPYLSKCKKAEEAYTRAFFNEETGLFCDNPQSVHSAVHSNLLPLLFGILPREDTRDRIVRLIKEKRLVSMGVYMAYFTLAALVRSGEETLALELIRDEDCWVNMIKEGATTTFEAWGKDQKWNTSLFHPWATAPIIILADNSPIY